MRRIARRTAVWAVAVWTLSAGLAAAEDAAPRARGGLRPSPPAASKDRHRPEAPEWAGPPIEMAPPWVGDGVPSKDRVLKMDPPRVRILSIDAVFEASDWAPVAGTRKP